MASDYLLQIDGIDGESTDDRHKGALEIDSFSWGVTQLTTVGGTGGGASAGKASFQDFHFTKLIDKASPKLFLACASGQHIKNATLFVRKASSERADDFYRVTFSDILVSSYQSSGASGGVEGTSSVPVDQFALNYAKIEFSYTPQKPDGTLGAPIATSWDLKLNKGA